MYYSLDKVPETGRIRFINVRPETEEKVHALLPQRLSRADRHLSFPLPLPSKLHTYHALNIAC